MSEIQLENTYVIHPKYSLDITEYIITFITIFHKYISFFCPRL